MACGSLIGAWWPLRHHRILPLMFSRIQIFAFGAIGVAALIAWGAVQHVRIGKLRAENATLSQSLSQAEADATRLRVTITAQTRRMERLQEEAYKADELRKQIEELNDETSAPDWLRDLPRRLQF